MHVEELLICKMGDQSWLELAPGQFTVEKQPRNMLPNKGPNKQQ